MTTISKPILFTEKHSELDWNDWLFRMESELKKMRYDKYFQNYKREDFSFWKIIEQDNKKIYQIGVLFYDFRRYNKNDPMANRVGVQYECMIMCPDRIDLSVSKDMLLTDFEIMCYEFYQSMKKFI